ncbi:MAG: HD domain-containing protein, partial [Pseudobdellovibrionaceae bacterium]
LAGLAFDSIFKIHPFSKPSVKIRLKQALRLGSLLHDIGHGPLSHTTEQVMPPVDDLKVSIYKKQKRKANHEDYTIKYVMDSAIAESIRKNFNDILPIHVACLIDTSIACPDDFFIDNNVDFRPILSQLVSSELDVDRMDYLLRDSYFCGTTYGQIDLHWILQNLTFHLWKDKAHLALNRRALYSFDDFLISRHHMHLMIYCHHKSIIYEEMLNKYLTSKNCQFKLPADINDYTFYNDYKLHEHLSQVKDNSWAQRIADRKPFKVLMEMHNTVENSRPEKIKDVLSENNIESIWASSKNRLSKYHQSDDGEQSYSIFVLDQYDKRDKPTRIGESTEIFKRYEGARIIDRIYVSPENYKKAESLIEKNKL